MEQGWDPEVKRFFRKIINSFSYGLIWLMSAVTLGFYFQLAYRTDISIWFNILFYVLLILSLFMLVRYLVRVWKR